MLRSTLARTRTAAKAAVRRVQRGVRRTRKRLDRHGRGQIQVTPRLIAVRRVVHYGRRHQCPVCGSTVRAFRAHGQPPRPAAICPVFGAMEWWRLGWWFVRERTDLFDGRARTMLHLAPEAPFALQLRGLPGLRYVTTDLSGKRVDLASDLHRLPFGDGTFDAIYCSHVLEHVDDDLVAMRELRRVVHPDGWAVVMVPVTAEATWGDPTITDPAERDRLFGQHDHVRRFGYDIIDRLESAGWSVQHLHVSELPATLRRRHGFPRGQAQVAGDVFWCHPA